MDKPGLQSIAADDRGLLQRLDGMGRIVVISSGEKKGHRITQAVHYCVQLDVQPAHSTANRFICRFSPPLALSCTLT